MSRCGAALGTRLAWLLLGLAIASASVAASAAEPLRLAGRTPLPGYTGDFDHFEYDLPGNRLWLAAEDHGTLDQFDLTTLKHQRSTRGIVSTPHAIAYVREKARLIVTDSGGNSPATKLIDATTNRRLGTLELAAPGSDAMVYDASTKRLYIVNGGRDARMKQTFLSVVDPVSLERIAGLRFETDKVEGIAVEQHGNRLYANLTAINRLAVVDKNTLAILAMWPIHEAEQNAPLALDEAGRRLFVVTRKPGKLIVINADSGESVASFDAPERCDQVIWDEANRRIYALGGDGTIGVFQQRSSDRYEPLPRIASAPGAKTGILVPELKRLYVAVSPGEARTGAAILQYDVAAANR